MSDMYYYGQGIDQDPQKAFELCRLAAEQDYLPAQGNLGSMCMNGVVTDKKYEHVFHQNLCSP